MEQTRKQNLKFKPRVYKNMNPVGKWGNIVFGLCECADCVVRVITFGRYATNLTSEHSRLMTQLHIAKQKQKAKVKL